MEKNNDSRPGAPLDSENPTTTTGAVESLEEDIVEGDNSTVSANAQNDLMCNILSGDNPNSEDAAGPPSDKGFDNVPGVASPPHHSDDENCAGDEHGSLEPTGNSASVNQVKELNDDKQDKIASLKNVGEIGRKSPIETMDNTTNEVNNRTRGAKSTDDIHEMTRPARNESETLPTEISDLHQVSTIGASGNVAVGAMPDSEDNKQDFAGTSAGDVTGAVPPNRMSDSSTHDDNDTPTEGPTGTQSGADISENEEEYLKKSLKQDLADKKTYAKVAAAKKPEAPNKSSPCSLKNEPKLSVKDEEEHEEFTKLAAENITAPCNLASKSEKGKSSVTVGLATEDSTTPHKPADESGKSSVAAGGAIKEGAGLAEKGSTTPPMPIDKSDKEKSSITAGGESNESSTTPFKSGDKSEKEESSVTAGESQKLEETLTELVQPSTPMTNNKPPSQEKVKGMSQPNQKQNETLPTDNGNGAPQENGSSVSTPVKVTQEGTGGNNLNEQDKLGETEAASKEANKSLDDIKNNVAATSRDTAPTQLRKRIKTPTNSVKNKEPPLPKESHSEEESLSEEPLPKELHSEEPLPEEPLPEEPLPEEPLPEEPLPEEPLPEEPHSSDEESDTSQPDGDRRQLNTMQILKILMLIGMIGITVLFGAVVFFTSNGNESGTSEPMQDSTFHINEDIITLNSQLWEGEELNILVIGRPGTGKSTLLRGLFEKDGHIVPLSLDRSHQKPTVYQKSHIINNVSISYTIWNHPKHEDLDGQRIKDFKKFDLILYMIKMSETRFPPKDSNIMKTMLEILGTEFVSKTVFILSYANQVGSLDNQNVHQKTKSILESKTHQWKEMIINKLNEHSEEDLKPEHFVHAGHPNEPNLYDVHWPNQVLAAMFDQLDDIKHPALARACEKYWIAAQQGSFKPGGCAS